MPPTCSVCTHKDRHLIDKALIEGATIRYIAGQYNLSSSAVQRHKDSHLPKKLAKAKEAKEVTEADSLMAELVNLKSKATSLLDQAEATQDYRTAIAAITPIRQVIETLAEIRGELNRQEVVNISISPVWVEIKAVVLDALQPYPEAKIAVANALKEIKQ